MTQNWPLNWLIAAGAGLIAAIVFVSASTGPMMMRLLLFTFTPLPIALIGVGWGWRVGAFAGVIGAVVIGLLTASLPLTALFALTQALPITVLVYQAGLSRDIEPSGTTPLTPSAQTGAPTPAGTPITEWYPVGRLVLWGCGLGAAVSVGLMLVVGANEASFVAELKTKLSEAIQANMSQMSQNKVLSEEDIATITKVAVAALPAGGAIAIAGSLLFCLWMAARVAFASQHLARPWPDLAAIDFPPGTPLALLIAMAGATFLSGPTALVATAATGALLFAYLLLGLGVVHYTTRGTSWRPFALWALYVGLLFIQGFAFLVMLLGIGEGVLRLRAKFGGPPDPTAHTPGST